MIWALLLTQSYFKILDIIAIAADPRTGAYGPILQKRPSTKVVPNDEPHVQKLINSWLALRLTDTCYNTLTMTHHAYRNERIANVIYEYTGQWRHRKHVSSHIEALRRISDRIPEDSNGLTQRFTQQLVCTVAKLCEANREDTTMISQTLQQIQQATLLLARRNHQTKPAPAQRTRRQRSGNALAPPKPQIRSDLILPDGPSYSLFREISRFTPQSDRELSLQLLRPLASNFLALSSVNHFSRTDVLQYIESQLSFDFTWDANDLKAFCTNIKPIYRRQVRHIGIAFVQSRASDLLTSSTTLGAYLSDTLPCLKTIFLTLIPCDPTLTSNLVEEYEDPWGQQTDRFLSSLGDLKATVILCLRSMHCEYFESKYVGARGWRYVRHGDVPDVHFHSFTSVLLPLALKVWTLVCLERLTLFDLVGRGGGTRRFPRTRSLRTRTREFMSWLRVGLVDGGTR